MTFPPGTRGCAVAFWLPYQEIPGARTRRPHPSGPEEFMEIRRRRASVAAGVLVPLGAAVAGGCFFLPYIRLLRLFGASLTLSGPRIGGALWLVPAVALAILLVQFGIHGAGRRRLRALLSAGGAALGLLLLFAVVLRLHHRVGFVIHFSAATFGVRPAGGWLGSLVGFAMSLGAALSELAPAGARARRQ
jgi:hypothetical protein